MRLPEGDWLVLDEVGSTQSVAADLVVKNTTQTGIVLAAHQTAGKGRLDRTWLSPKGTCLAATLIFRSYSDHPMPWLVGMSLAVAAAGAVHCRVQWPNDLVLKGKKLGGILTELVPDSSGRQVPIVGIGINLGPIAFPSELAEKATTLTEHRDVVPQPQEVLSAILDRLTTLPEPESWHAVEPVWRLFDATPGKRYRLPTGEEAIALGVGSKGELLCSVEGESTSVMAGDALFGPISG